MKELDEKILEKELEVLADDMPEYGNLEKNIERKIKKKIQKTVVRTLAWILGIVIVLLLIINPFLNMVFPNPTKSSEYPGYANKETVLALRSYWETMQPYIEPTDCFVEKKGFGKYQLKIGIDNHRGFYEYGRNNVVMDLKCGKYSVAEDPQGLTSVLMNRFSQDWNGKEDYMEKIKELPQSAVLYLSVGEKNPRSIEELRKEAVKLQWVEIYQPNVEFQGGLNMWVSYAWDEKDRKRETMNMQELKEVYVSNLENILEHPEIINSFGVSCGNTIYPVEGGRHQEVLQACYEDAKKLETLESKNYCISGKRDEIVAYLEKIETVSLSVDEIKLSELER